MKFWQLVSMTRQCGGGARIAEIAGLRAEWNRFGAWMQDFARLVDARDRSKLDFELPNAFSRQVLEGIDSRFYLSSEFLHSLRQSAEDEQVSALDAFDRFGGAALEEAREFGSWPIGGLR